MTTKCCYIPRRYIMIIFAHFGFFVVYALRVNLSVVLVAMVNSTYVRTTGKNAESGQPLDSECPAQKNDTIAEYVS